MRNRIGTYRIEKRLDERGKGVFECIGDAHRRVVVRALGSSAIAESELRTVREAAEAVKRIDDPAVAAFHDLIEQDGELFAVTELVEGPTLEAIPVAAAVSIVARLLGALHCLHVHGIAHGNICARNVVIVDGGVKLVDAGIAHISSLLRRSAAVDARTDLHGVGQILARFSGLTPAVHEVIAIALRAEPADRFPSAAAFRNALLDAEAGLFPAAPEPAPAPRNDDVVPSMPQRVAPAPTAPHKRRPVVSWMVTGTSLVISSMLLSTRSLRPAPPPPASTTTVIVREPAIAQPPPVIASAASTKPLPLGRPKKAPFSRVDPKPVPKRDTAEADRRAEIDLLLTQIGVALGRANANLEAGNFDDARKALDGVALTVARFPDDFRNEIEEMRRMNARVEDARVAERLEMENKIRERAAWDRRLEEVRKIYDEKDYPGAKKAAIRLLAEPGIPDWVAAPAKELQDAAHQAIVRGFQGTQTGATRNDIRRPRGH